KIRQWFKKKDRAENIVHGRESLERELRRLSRKTIQGVGKDKIAEGGKGYNYGAREDFYAAIGYGAVSPQQVVAKLGVLDDTEVGLPTVAPPALPARARGGRGQGVGGR